VTTNLAIFTLAAFFEIAGCFAFWMWLRRGVTPFIALLGIASLIGFAVALTRVDSAFAGRAYAAYGGIYLPHRSCGYARPRANGPPLATSSERPSR
jgi:small multidrug resistance family-3 protein